VTVAGASDAVCLGRPATIIAKAGGVTRGTPGNDVIVGSKAADRVTSGAGRDLVCGRGGADLVRTGAGADRVSPPVPAKTGS
jgi:Ca2+-binding RTX toxin-like protein